MVRVRVVVTFLALALLGAGYFQDKDKDKDKGKKDDDPPAKLKGISAFGREVLTTTRASNACASPARAPSASGLWNGLPGRSAASASVSMAWTTS